VQTGMVFSLGSMKIEEPKACFGVVEGGFIFIMETTRGKHKREAVKQHQTVISGNHERKILFYD
jgi:hypothetical protein